MKYWLVEEPFHALRIQSPCQMMIGVYNHLLSKVFRFHCHSQKVIGSLGTISIDNQRQYNSLPNVGSLSQSLTHIPRFPPVERSSQKVTTILVEDGLPY